MSTRNVRNVVEEYDLGRGILLRLSEADREASAGPSGGLSFALGTPLRAVLDLHVADVGSGRERLRESVKLAAAVEAITVNCGERWREVLLRGRLSPKAIRSLGNTHADHQRFRVEALAAGRAIGAKPEAGLPPYETLGWYEVPGRVARAEGIARRAAGNIGATTAGMDADGLRSRFARTGLLAATLKARLLSCLGEAADRPDEIDPGRLVRPGYCRKRTPPTTGGPRRKVASVGGRLNQVDGFLMKNLRDLPRLVRESGVDRGKAAATVARLAAIERITEDALARLGGRPALDVAFPPPAPSDRRIATHRSPDVDAVVACWLAERHLFPGERAEVVFVPRGYAVPADCPCDCVLDVGRRHDPLRLLFDHKPPAVADRHSTCATKQLWEHLRSSGREVITSPG